MQVLWNDNLFALTSQEDRFCACHDRNAHAVARIPAANIAWMVTWFQEARGFLSATWKMPFFFSLVPTILTDLY